jgi:putative aldouronate transport system substrate-binding protein
MKSKKWFALVCATALITAVAAGCSSQPASTDPNGAGTTPDSTKPSAPVDNTPYPITMAIQQVDDIPAKGNEFEQLVEKYTNTKLDIQWIPRAAYDEKINVMIASGELPKIVRMNYIPTTLSAMRGGAFWELGPYLKEFKNIGSQDPQYYDNISVDGKVYGIPNYREIGRGGYFYRKDWFDALGLKEPKSLDDWYNIHKVIGTSDPDKNGKQDQYATMLFKDYNQTTQPPLTRIAVQMGGVNRWGVKDGKFTPEFMTKEYEDAMKLYRRLYEEKLVNSDFAALDRSELQRLTDNGKVGMYLHGVFRNGKSFQDRLSKIVPEGVYELANFEGPNGIRLAGEPGNFGLLAIPKSSVKTEADLKKVLGFIDQLLDPEMSTLLAFGIENKHFAKTSTPNQVEYKDFAGFQREIKPYRDNLVYIEGYNVPELKDTPLGTKGASMSIAGLKYAVPNPAVSLPSDTYTERGKELDQMIWDAQTKYIMGKIDDEGWKKEIDSWLKAGGAKVIQEYEESYKKYGSKK